MIKVSFNKIGEYRYRDCTIDRVTLEKEITSSMDWKLNESVVYSQTITESSLVYVSRFEKGTKVKKITWTYRGLTISKTLVPYFSPTLYHRYGHASFNVVGWRKSAFRLLERSNLSRCTWGDRLLDGSAARCTSFLVTFPRVVLKNLVPVWQSASWLCYIDRSTTFEERHYVHGISHVIATHTFLLRLIYRGA